MSDIESVCVVAVIPAWDEELSVGGVVQGLRSVRAARARLERIIVVDNASSDRTAQVAAAAGAEVVFEPERGYGSACLRGISAVGRADIVLFVDADGSDVPTEWPSLVEPIVSGKAKFVVGSRVRGKSTRGALLFHQRFGNVLATFLLSLLYQTRFTDLGPFRAICSDALHQLDMRDRDFGWTVEMQIKALRNEVQCMEVPVSYRPRRTGRSKVAGSIRGSFLAGKKILTLVFLEVLHLGIPGVVQNLFRRRGGHVRVADNSNP